MGERKPRKPAPLRILLLDGGSYPENELRDTIMIGDPNNISAHVRSLLKRYGFKQEADYYHWSRPSKGNVPGESDIIMDAMQDEYFAQRRGKKNAI